MSSTRYLHLEEPATSARPGDDRLSEHNSNVKKEQADGFLAQHCKNCPCRPIIEDAAILGKSLNKMTRLIIEAYHIATFSGSRISKPPISLSGKEVELMRMA